MKLVVLFHLFLCLFLLINTATAQSVITIDILEDGNAVWIMEEYLPLANQNEIDISMILESSKEGSMVLYIPQK
jgi:hypothetical protein